MPAGLSRGPRVGYDLTRVGAGLSRGPSRKKTMVAAAWSGTWPAPGAALDLDFANNRGLVRGHGQRGVMDGIEFSRASTGNYLDSAGLLQSAASGAARFDWGSVTVLAGNQLTFTEQLSAVAWTTINVTVTVDAAVAPDGATSADKLTATGTGAALLTSPPAAISAATSTFSFYAKADTSNWVACSNGSFFAYFNVGTGALGTIQDGGAGTITSVGAGWYRCTWTPATVANNGAFRLRLAVADGNTTTTTESAFFWGAQAEVGAAATAYKAIAQPTINTPLAAAASCNGILIEEQRTNRLLWCRDATQADWVKTNVTPTLDQTGIDGAANTASRLTATAADGTCTQTVVLAAGARACAVYLKRITGTGTVQVTLDGTTWSTADLSGGTWCRIAMTGTVTNPVVGVKIVTNGDEVALDYAQLEDGTFSTSPILTTTASATRNADFPTVATETVAATEAKLFQRPRAMTICAEYLRRQASVGNVWNTQEPLRAELTTTTLRFVVFSPQSNAITDRQLAFNKIAGAMNADGSFRGAANGVAFANFNATPTGAGLKSGILRIGCSSNGSIVLNGCVRRITAWFGTLPSNESLLELTR